MIIYRGKRWTESCHIEWEPYNTHSKLVLVDGRSEYPTNAYLRHFVDLAEQYDSCPQCGLGSSTESGEVEW